MSDKETQNGTGLPAAEDVPAPEEKADAAESRLSDDDLLSVNIDNAISDETAEADLEPADNEISEKSETLETLLEKETDSERERAEKPVSPAPETSEEEEAALTAQVKELDGLLAELGVTEEDMEGPMTNDSVNDDDSPEKADEVGVGFDTDGFGREILSPVFENYLRMSRNSVKLAYGRLKNAILRREGVKQRFFGDSEIFSRGEEKLFRFRIENDELAIYCAPISEPSPERFGFTIAEESRYKQTPLKVSVKRERGGEEKWRKAYDLVRTVLDERDIREKEYYVPTAYAERYPLNPSAVVKGDENVPPLPDRYDSTEYDPVSGELSRDIAAELMGDDFDLAEKEGGEKLQGLRQQAKTIKAAVALAEPVVYFYDGALNADNSINYVHATQVLNDKFMGKLLPHLFFAAAEGSNRIERLNFLCLKQIIKDSEDNPDYSFCTEISCRLLLKPKTRDRLVKMLKESGRAEKLILAFDGALIEASGKEAYDGINAVKNCGARIMIDNTENSGARVLTEIPIDYLRFDARYYNETETNRNAHLGMLTAYAKTVGITASSVNVNTVKEAGFLIGRGVDVIQGYAVCEPKRIVFNAIKGVKRLAQRK